MLFKKNQKKKYRTLFKHFIGHAVFMFMQQLDLKRHVQSVPINSKDVSLNPAQNENLYLIPHQFDKVCQLLVTDRWFSPGTPVYCTNKADRHDITVILMKVVLSITLTHSLHHDQTVADRMQALQCNPHKTLTCPVLIPIHCNESLDIKYPNANSILVLWYSRHFYLENENILFFHVFNNSWQQGSTNMYNISNQYSLATVHHLGDVLVSLIAQIMVN